MTTVPGLPALHINQEWEAWATAVHDAILANADLDTASLASLAASVAATYSPLLPAAVAAVAPGAVPCYAWTTAAGTTLYDVNGTVL